MLKRRYAQFVLGIAVCLMAFIATPAIAAITGPTTIALGLSASPFAVIASQHSDHIYVGGNSSNSIYKISTVDNTFTSIANIGDAPEAMVESPTGDKLFISLYTDDEVKVVNTVTFNQVNATFSMPTGTGASGIAVSPDGNYVYVAGSQSSELVTINLTSGAITQQALAQAPHDVDISPDGQLAYLTNEGASTITVLKLSDNSVNAVIPVGSNPFTSILSSDGKRLFVANSNSNTVSVINTITNQVISTIPVVAYTRFISISPDGSTLAVSGYTPGGVSLVDIATATVTETLHFAGSGYYEGVTFARDGASLWQADQSDNAMIRWEISPPLITPTPTPSPATAEIAHTGATSFLPLGIASVIAVVGGIGLLLALRNNTKK